ncbi:hypothetical protein FACS189430_11640 [Bacteroidia bacterium]|nr:hypothetical protein FACS189430_11640 [Bacteroidia bacterium]
MGQNDNGTMKKYKVQYKKRKLFTWIELSRDGRSAPFRFLIDTGAQCTVMSEKAAFELMFDVDNIKKRDTIISANGEPTLAGKVRLPLFEAFGWKEKNFEVYVLELMPGFSGVIGNDFLEKFKKFRIYYDTQEVEVG